MSAIESKTRVQKAEGDRKGLMEIVDFELNLEGLCEFFFLHLIMKIFKPAAKLKEFILNICMPTTYIV